MTLKIHVYILIHDSWLVMFSMKRSWALLQSFREAFDVAIHFENDDLKNLIFYGDITIEADNIVQIMDIMAATNKFNYRYDMDKKEIRIYH